MTRKRINQQQVNLYMKYRQNGNLTQEVSAAKSGISVRSARTIDKGQHYTQLPNKVRDYKTRKSIIDDVWNNELKQMLEANPCLQPSTLFIYLERTHKDDTNNPIYPVSCLRTLQRKVAKWKAINGPSKDIIIPQNHLPGQQSLSDFTRMGSLGITISGEPFRHMLYHFRLIYSKWSYVKVIQGGESFQALAEGLQEALVTIGGSTKEHRTDSLAAAYKNRHDETHEDLTERYHSLCQFYQMQPTRNNKGISHENGSVESAHGHLKNRVKQELIIRGGSDFDTIGSYEQWLKNIVINSNKQNSKHFALEQQSLQPLPVHKTMDYELFSAKISNLSMMVVRNMTYSVPSRLAGHTITLHLYQKTIEGYLGNVKVLSIERKYQHQGQSRYVIDYKHVISAFVRKPQAFRFCKYRDELLPNEGYRKIWQYLDTNESRDVAPKIMLRILKLAADYHCEYELEQRVLRLVQQKATIDINILEQDFNNSTPKLPIVTCLQHNLAGYDHYITGTQLAPKGEQYATA